MITESAKARKRMLTIYGKEYPSIVEEFYVCVQGSGKMLQRIIKRKYYLVEPLEFREDGIFQIVQDNELVLNCYMSDDRMRLIEV